MKTIEQLNQELETVLTPLEARGKVITEEEQRPARLEAAKAELRAEYEQKVAPVLATVAPLEKKLRLLVARVGPVLDSQQVDGASETLLRQARETLTALQGRLNQPAQFRRIPAKIEALLPDYDSVTGQPMGSAEIRIQLQGAARLLETIEQLYARLVERVAAVASGPHRPVKKGIVLEPPPRTSAPGPISQTAEFNVFG